MASGGEVGLDLDVSLVPRREEGMEPFEVMISESQERMLCVIEPERMAQLEEICERWEVRATAIGEVTDSRRLRVLDAGEVVGDMPVEALVDECPLYDLAARAAERSRSTRRPPRVLDSDDPREVLLALMDSANLSLAPPAVRAVRPDGGLAHRAPPAAGRRRGAPARPTTAVRARIAVSIDGNGRRVACDPYWGAVEAVLECAANLACVGRRAARASPTA